VLNDVLHFLSLIYNIVHKGVIEIIDSIFLNMIHIY